MTTEPASGLPALHGGPCPGLTLQTGTLDSKISPKQDLTLRPRGCALEHVGCTGAQTEQAYEAGAPHSASKAHFEA